MENDSLVAERERILLEELESLKRRSVPGKERLLCELQNSSTQTEVIADFDFLAAVACKTTKIPFLCYSFYAKYCPKRRWVLLEQSKFKTQEVVLVDVIFSSGKQKLV